MLFKKKRTPEQLQFLHAVFTPALITLAFVLVFILERGLGAEFHKAGIMPRDFSKIWNILSYVFIHADWGHLLNNSISFLVLGTCLFFFYKQLSYSVLLISWIMSGIILWSIGRESWHIGASGLIYSIAFFLFFSGLIRKHIPLIAISLIITFLYGSMVWHLFPWQVNDPISWEGHLSGGITGLIMSIIFRKSGPQKPITIWDEEESDEEENSNEIDFQLDNTNEQDIKELN
jgi:membrane associated rhomboid family serine protease